MSTWARSVPLTRKVSSRTTECPPRLALEPPPGCVGGGEVGVEVELDEPEPDELLEVVEPPELEEPVPEVATKNCGGVENGSRPVNTATGVGVVVGATVGVTVGVADRAAVGGSAVSVPPPPLRTLNRTSPTIRTPATMPPILSVRLSLSEIGMARWNPLRLDRAPSRVPRSYRSCRSGPSRSASAEARPSRPFLRAPGSGWSRSAAGRGARPPGSRPRRRRDPRRAAPGGYPSAVTSPLPRGVSTSWVRSTLVVNVNALGTVAFAVIAGIHGFTQPFTSSSRVNQILNESNPIACPPVVIVPINGVVVVVPPVVAAGGPVIVAVNVSKYASLGITRDRSINIPENETSPA